MEPKPNIFQEFDLSENEVLIALNSFNDLQYAFVQNERARIAQLKMHTEIQEGDVKEFERQHVYLAGQLEALSWLLKCVEINAQKKEEKVVTPEQPISQGDK